MNNLKIIALIIICLCNFNLKGQKSSFEQWFITKEYMKYIDKSLSNENVVFVNTLDQKTGLYSINDLQFYKTNDCIANFSGGKDSLQYYIKNNLQYQPYNNINPIIYLAFIVDKKGNLLYVGILRGAEENYNKAALDLVKNMPRWEPANYSGKSVASFNTLKIDFAIQ